MVMSIKIFVYRAIRCYRNGGDQSFVKIPVTLFFNEGMAQCTAIKNCYIFNLWDLMQWLLLETRDTKYCRGPYCAIYRADFDEGHFCVVSIIQRQRQSDQIINWCWSLSSKCSGLFRKARLVHLIDALVVQVIITGRMLHWQPKSVRIENKRCRWIEQIWPSVREMPKWFSMNRYTISVLPWIMWHYLCSYIVTLHHICPVIWIVH